MTDMTDPARDEKTCWLDHPRNVTKLFRGLVVVCALLLAADAVYDKHVELEAETWFGFYAIFGFVACVALVLAAKELRKFLMRDEDYYDR